MRVLICLPERERTVYLAHVLSGRTVSVLADEYEKPKSTMAGRVALERKKLRTIVMESGHYMGVGMPTTKSKEIGLFDPFTPLIAEYGDVLFHPVINVKNARILHVITQGSATIINICERVPHSTRDEIEGYVAELVDAKYVRRVRGVWLDEVHTRYFISDHGRQQFVQFLAAIDAIIEPYLQRVR